MERLHEVAMIILFLQLIRLESLWTLDIREYCHLETFNATCHGDKVIIIQHARYGRMSLGRCVSKNLGYVGCGIEVMEYMDTKCSGRHHCRVPIVDLALAEMTPCPADVTSYLEASYKCLDVSYGDRLQCRSKRYITPTGDSGYLASIMAAEQGYGGQDCPWLIQAKVGQTVSLTLHNYARIQTSDGTMSELNPDQPDICYEYAVIRDGASKKSITACGSARTQHIYTSRTNSVQIHMANAVASRESVGHFILEYKVIGCPDMKALPNSKATRSGDNLIIKCNNTEETWYLTCKENQWIGDVGNCTKGTSQPWNLGKIFGKTQPFPYGILIVVAVGVALGVFFGGLLLVIVNTYMKRRRRRREEMEETPSQEHLGDKVCEGCEEYSKELYYPKNTLTMRTTLPPNLHDHGSEPVLISDTNKAQQSTAVHFTHTFPRHHHYESPQFT